MNWQSVVRDGAIVAALMSLEGEVIPVEGAFPVLEVHWDGGEENAPGIAESFQIQAERDGISYLITLETNEEQTRLPINPVALTGTATSTSTATGTLSVSALPIDVDGDTAFAQDIAPPLYPEFATLQGAEETERIPVSAVALSGTATSASTAIGTLSVAGVTIEPTDYVPLEGPDQDATTAILMAADGEVIPVSGSVDAPPAGDVAPLEDDSAEVALSLAPPEYHGPYPEHELPINPRAITGTATSTSTATGTLSVAGTTVDVSADTEVADKLAPASDSITPHLEAEADQQVPIKPVSISGAATSTSTATGTLSNAVVNLDVSGDTAVAPFLAPDRDATTAIYQATLDGESIPVSGTIAAFPGTATLSDTAPVATLSDTSPTASISDSPAPTATLSDSAPTATLSDSAPTATISDAIP